MAGIFVELASFSSSLFLMLGCCGCSLSNIGGYPLCCKPGDAYGTYQCPGNDPDDYDNVADFYWHPSRNPAITGLVDLGPLVIGPSTAILILISVAPTSRGEKSHPNYLSCLVCGLTAAAPTNPHVVVMILTRDRAPLQTGLDHPTPVMTRSNSKT